jgi:hypothetical protein
MLDICAIFTQSHILFLFIETNSDHIYPFFFLSLLEINMSMLNFVRHPLKILMHSRLFIYRQQSQNIVDLLNKKTPIEIESNDELENLPCENTIEWNKKLKSYRIRGEGKKALKFFEIGLRKHQFQPDYITYISMLELCKDIKDVDNGRYIHRQILNTEVRDNTRIQSLLMV